MEKKKAGGLSAILSRHGIQDPFDYLECKGATAEVAASTAPDVRFRGSIQLMKKQQVSRSEVDKRLSELKYL